MKSIYIYIETYIVTTYFQAHCRPIEDNHWKRQRVRSVFLLRMSENEKILLFIKKYL